VAIAKEQRTDGVDDEGEDGEDAKGPGQAQVLEHGLRGQTVDQPAQAGPGGGKAIGKRAMGSEPLGGNADAGDEEKAHAPAEAQALGEEQVADARGEAGGDEGRGLQEHANEEGGAGAEEAGGAGGNRGDDEGLGDGEAPDEGVVQRCCAREQVVGEVVGQEDGVGTVEAPRMSMVMVSKVGVGRWWVVSDSFTH